MLTSVPILYCALTMVSLYQDQRLAGINIAASLPVHDPSHSISLPAIMEVPSVGGRKPRMLSRQVMAEILQPRAEEIFTLIHEEVTRAGFEKLLNAGVVLTGGGSLLPGMVEVAEQVFDLPVRLGRPGGVNGLTEPASGPQFATAVGLALYSARHTKDHPRGFTVSPGMFIKLGHRVRTWFADMF